MMTHRRSQKAKRDTEPVLKDIPPQQKPKDDEISSHCVFEVIEPGQPRLKEKLVEYAGFRYRRHPEVRSELFQEIISQTMFDRMLTIPARFALLRYNGPKLDVGVEQQFTLNPGSVVGVNSSKQTFVYPKQWFESLLASEGRQTMDNLTTAVTSGESPHPFKPFGFIENLREGPLRQGEGAGFLLLALVDDRLLGVGLSQTLLPGLLRYYLENVKVPYVFVYGRMPNLSKDPLIQQNFQERGVVETGVLNGYIKQVLNGERHDWGVGLHKMAGAHVICGLPDSVLDKESLNCGYLGIYDLTELRRMRRI